MTRNGSRNSLVKKLTAVDYGGMSAEGFHNLLEILREFGATNTEIDEFATIYLKEVELLNGASFDIVQNEKLMQMWGKLTAL